MDNILQQIHLGTLAERFKEEKIEVETVLSATDNELIRIGVDTIGDRVRLRELCRKKSEESTNNDSSSTPGTSGESMSSRIRTERALLFNSSTTGGTSGRLSRAATGNRRRKNAATGKKRTWTAQFMCLAHRFAAKVPNASEKLILSKAGLGVKKIKFEMDDDEETVTNKIMSDVKDNDGAALGFPQLRGIGGFEMLHCLPNCRDLRLIDCSWSVKDLKSNVGGSQSKIYLRPIQQSLSTKSLVAESDSSLKEKCKYCNNEILMRKLRDHIFTCSAGLLEESDDENDPDPVSPDNDNSQRESLHMERTTRANMPVAEPITSYQEKSDSILPVDEIVAHVQVTQSEHVIVDLTHTVSDDNSGKKTVTDIAQEAVAYCKAENITDHVEILRYLQSVIVHGRPLEIQNIEELVEGATNFILVDRNNLLITSFDEIGTIEDLRLTLEVQFYNEVVADYGGPRKEFFRLIIKEIKAKFFDNGIREHVADQYKLVGIIFGLSILQNGKVPQFIPENILHAIFSENEVSAAITNLREGFMKTGLYQVGCQLPTFLELFQPTQATLTLKVLTNLLQPKFSEEGSNSWTFERLVYSAFLKYLRETAAGRRNTVTLGHVLQFATSADEEPVLGFSIHPSLEFYEVSSSFLSTSNTCSNCLYLPRPSHQVALPSQLTLFNLYDYAFSNAYFGNR